MYLIGTAGPKIRENVIMKGIIESGINVLRLNFSHGTEQEFLDFLNKSRYINSSIKILVDMSGTKIRVSDQFEYIYKIYNGEEIIFCGEDRYDYLKKKINNKKIIPLNIEDEYLYKNNYNMISIKDNTMQFEVLEKSNLGIKVKTVTGGVIRKGKGCNIKGFKRSHTILSEKDKKAILWGIDNNTDIFCQSFVEERRDIDNIKKFILDNSTNFNPKIWAKIETEKGMVNIDDIIQGCDGIIIGRGDMISETNIEDIPIYEENLIKTIKKYNKDIIIATHILDSMKEGKRPTICESEAVYNFIKKGVNGFLLAGETSIGRAPVKSVQFLKELVNKYMNS